MERGRITCTEDGSQMRKRSIQFSKQESNPHGNISRDSSIMQIRDEDEEAEKETTDVEKFQIGHSLGEDENELEGTMSADLKGINSKVFLSYIKWAGIPLSIAVVLSLTLLQAGNNCADFWLSVWTNSSQEALPDIDEYSMSFYLAVYGGIIAAVIVFTSFRAVTFAYAGIRASIHAHRSLLETTLLAQMSFFETVSTGQILNRFSGDMSTIDDGLPFMLNIFLASLGRLLGSIVLICVVLPLLLLLFVPMMFVYWSIQHTYRRAARDLKRISSVASSPVYSWLVETITGLSCIRGMGKDVLFRNEFLRRLGDRIRSDVAICLASAWLTLRLQLLGQSVVASILLVSLLGEAFHWWSSQLSILALAITYAVNIAGQMSGCLTSGLETETRFIALERAPLNPGQVMHLRKDLKKQLRSRIEADDVRAYEVDVNCADYGKVEFEDVSVEYPKYLKKQLLASLQDEFLALDGISFALDAGQNIGIVGRTGSGKSSLLKALLRLIPHLSGPEPTLQKARVRNFKGVSGTVSTVLI
ncbi:Multidrug resistance-associated protein 7 [Cichlidogyrus casuarinus]|uniref:Multidrug resistance-associated protein 7 n=1 Tax=Cichlidogyrus casuarinus TaxID=1844966 RepID=A0ABD2PYM5_9PLAT